MKEISKKIGTSILSSIIFLLIGILLTINPEIIITSISYMIGGVLIVNGLWTIIKYVGDKDEKTLVNFNLIYAIISAFAGLLVILNPTAIASILVYVISFWIIVNSFIKMQMSLALKKKNVTRWKMPFFMSLFTFILALFLIFNPFLFFATITQVLGIFMIIYSVIDIIQYITVKKTMKEFDKVIDAEVTSEKEN